MRTAALLLAALLPTAGVVRHAAAASFDCTRAATATERAICADPELSALDERMAIRWQALSSLDRDEAEQRRWLQRTRDACRTDACLVDAYRRRIDALDGWTEPDPAGRPVTGHFSREVRTGDMQGNRWTATDCLSLVPDGPGRARLALSLNFANGHMCNATGIVRWSRDGHWTWRRPEGHPDDGCRLTIAVHRSSLSVHDPGFACLRSVHMGCGARGSFENSHFSRGARVRSPAPLCANGLAEPHVEPVPVRAPE